MIADNNIDKLQRLLDRLPPPELLSPTVRRLAEVARQVVADYDAEHKWDAPTDWHIDSKGAVCITKTTA